MTTLLFVLDNPSIFFLLGLIVVFLFSSVVQAVKRADEELSAILAGKK
jgi:hypothetical protein